MPQQIPRSQLRLMSERQRRGVPLGWGVGAGCGPTPASLGGEVEPYRPSATVPLNGDPLGRRRGRAPLTPPPPVPTPLLKGLKQLSNLISDVIGVTKPIRWK